MFGITTKAILIGGGVAVATYLVVNEILKSNERFEAKLAEDKEAFAIGMDRYLEELTGLNADLQKNIATANFWDIVTREG